jgi:DNA invertase Pin-like site-specific DNA recombinase
MLIQEELCEIFFGGIIMKRACGYIRVSTDRQEEYSPDAQLRLILDYCAKNEYVISKEDIFEDIGISGKLADKRDGFIKMIGMCKTKEHPYDVIVVWKFSRFARNQEESIVYKSMLRKIGIEVVSISEPIADGLGGKLTEAILEIMDEYYSINLSQEVMRGMTQKAMSGRYLGNVPYGYTKTDSLPVPNEEEAKIVRYIFTTFANTRSYASIVKTLNHQGIRTRNGNDWTRKTVNYILCNPFYAGFNRWNYSTHKHGRVLNDESQWIIVPGNHEPIVDQKLYDDVKSIIESKQKPTAPRGRLPRVHFLSGVLKCARCGRSMSCHKAVEKRNQSAYFICRSAVINHSCDYSQYTIVPKMEEAFFKALHDLTTDERFKKAYIETPADNEAEIIIKNLEAIKIKEDRIKKAYRDGIDTLEEYKENKALLQKEKARLEDALANTASIKKEPLLNQILQLEKFLKSDEYDVEAKHAAITQIVDKIVYDKELQQLDIFLLPSLY